MARNIKCYACGTVFPVQDSEIQICPMCRRKMKVGRPGSSNAAPSNLPARNQARDEYDSIRQEYLEMMKDTLDEHRANKDNMVVLPKNVYNAMIDSSLSRPALNSPVGGYVDDDYRDDYLDDYSDGYGYDEGSSKKSKKGNGVSSAFALALLILAMIAPLISLFIYDDVHNSLFNLIVGTTSRRAIATYVTAVAFPMLLSLIFLLLKNKKAAKIIFGFLYLIAGAILLTCFKLAEFIQNLQSFDFLEVLQFWDYASIPDVIAGSIVLGAGLFLIIIGITQKKRKQEPEDFDDYDDQQDRSPRRRALDY